MKRLFAALAAVACAAMPVSAETVRVVRAYDGDTATLSTGETIRLACIDSPEIKGQRADPVPAIAARDHLRSMIVGRDVVIRRITTDRYGRTVAELFVDGTNVQQAMVASGHAEIYWRYARQCPWTK